MEGRTTFWPDGTSSVFSRLAHHDFLTFLAIAQRLYNLPVLNDQGWSERFKIWRIGGNGAIHNIGSDMVLKRSRITDEVGERLAYKTLICELLVLAHPVLKHHRNIGELRGITWDVRAFQGSSIRAMPALVFHKCDSGTLAEFMNSKLPFSQRISLCEDIGRAIEAMHALSTFHNPVPYSETDCNADVVHGDVKPDNVLVFPEAGGFIAKVIDFGCSTFGAATDDLVLIGRTVPWAAPELRDTPITVMAAMQADIYSYGKVCAWILFGQEMSLADFASLPFDFNQAVARQMQITNSEWDELRNRPTVLRNTLPSLEKFFERSLQPLTQIREQNVGSLTKIWEQLCGPQDQFFKASFAEIQSGRKCYPMISALLPDIPVLIPLGH